jgi:hypothetical protein
MSDAKQTPQPPRGGSMPAGLEHPPRRYPPAPEPQPQIPQTYDPRVSVQLERTARDLAAGKPGTAAREDLERATDDPRGGARLQPRAVESVAERDTVVTFATHFASYNAGESACFTPEEAQRLADLGVTDVGGGGPPPTEAPVNIDVPHVTQAGAVLTCTMGNWSGTPTGYAYQWQLDGAPIGTDAATYTRDSADVGHTAACVVTATNAIGSTAAPPSNAVTIT